MSFDFLSLSGKHYRKLLFWHPNFYLFVEIESKFWRSFFNLLNKDGSDRFHHDDVFKTTSKILEQLPVGEEDIIPECQIQAAVVENDNSNFCNFYGYFRDLETAMKVNCASQTHHCIFGRGIENLVPDPIGKQSVQHYTWFWII